MNLCLVAFQFLVQEKFAYILRFCILRFIFYVYQNYLSFTKMYYIYLSDTTFFGKIIDKLIMHFINII